MIEESIVSHYLLRDYLRVFNCEIDLELGSGSYLQDIGSVSFLKWSLKTSGQRVQLMGRVAVGAGMDRLFFAGIPEYFLQKDFT
jgi:hypothetical protein